MVSRKIISYIYSSSIISRSFSFRTALARNTFLIANTATSLSLRLMVVFVMILKKHYRQKPLKHYMINIISHIGN